MYSPPNNTDFHDQPTQQNSPMTSNGNVGFQQPQQPQQPVAGQFVRRAQPAQGQGPWNWYKRQKNITKIGIVCGTVLLAVLVYALSAAAMAVTNTSSPSKQAKATAGATVTGQTNPPTVQTAGQPTPTAAAQPTQAQNQPASVQPTSAPAKTAPTKPAVSASTSGHLTIKITDASAVNKSHGSVSVHTLPGAALTIKVVYCSGDTAPLPANAFADASGNYTWSWKPDTSCTGPAAVSVTAKLGTQTAASASTFEVQ